ncbi:Pre-mRNA splicing Prp18-interacting factor-domain-containing protein [Dunaliella salina]|uniref:Pre-mRNA-splicing factor SLU7 n=1 Tax=Dunaliella salina TaxID=3046 RepID=A0ABQ7GT04_DUNSA|nr:Pre-mRNA splicing Prp18-interacting factor-domain-containing protein [Dunaliella salina]|eukprot:KAF5837705.1 Pre-mRNA splicing Prp18-interacting factor-domain-containing protein [Dunaliella salina]
MFCGVLHCPRHLALLVCKVCEVIDRHEHLENIRKEMKQKEAAQQMYNGQRVTANQGDEARNSDDDDAKMKEEEESGFAEVKKRVRTTAGGSTGSVRNLRIREDTAKYLLNLDPNSAYYDPKSSEKGVELNVMANPSISEKLYEQFKKKKNSLNKVTKEDILNKYGSCADDVVENKTRSRYEEDVFINNHSSVWGSYWKDGNWGYACCHQTLRNSYCTGRAGEKASADVAAQMITNMQNKAREAEADLQSDTADVELDEAKVKAALAKMDKEDAEAVASGGEKRKYNSLDSGEVVTPEEMEAWRMKRARGADDPLLQAAKSKAESNGEKAAVGGYELL